MADVQEESAAVTNGTSADDADSLRQELEKVRNELAESQEEKDRIRSETESRTRELMEKTKAHMKSMQEKMSGAMAQKESQLKELESEKAQALAQVAALDAKKAEEVSEVRASLEARSQEVADAESRASASNQECAALREKLRSYEEREGEQVMSAAIKKGEGEEDATTSGGELEACRSELKEACGARDAALSDLQSKEQELEALRAQLQGKEQQVTELQDEMGRLRQETEAKLGQVVAKAKEHVKQVQTRLEASTAENKDLTDKYRELDQDYAQQQEKVTKYKQLMAQANSRIEDGDNSMRELKEAFGKMQAQKTALEEQFGIMEKSNSVPPSKEEIARTGGILLAVEADNDDVWCLVQSDHGEKSLATRGEKRWWLLSQLSIDEKPVPLQRRWKGEVSALRAQMSRFKKKSEDLQEEFEGYRQKANAALQSGATGSEEIQAREKRIERLGQQLQAKAVDLEKVQEEKAKALDDLGDVRKRLLEASAQRSELETLLDLRLREAEEAKASAVRDCRRELEAEKDALEQRWLEKTRTYQQELDLRRAQKESLDEEIETLRARLANRFTVSTAFVEPTESDEEDGRGPAVASSRDDDAAGGFAAAASSGAAALPAAAAAPAPTDGPGGGADRPSPWGEVQAPAWASEPRAASPEGPVASAVQSASTQGSGTGEDPASERAQVPPPQPGSLHASVAWQDLVNLRSQVRQLENTLGEERQAHASTRRESASLTSELREVKQQQSLQNTIGQHQQMEYIRNVFRRFVETMPAGTAETEQLIPVLMTFFQCTPDEVRRLQEKRQGSSKSQMFGRLFSGFTG
mmetsp:Transcript_63787/g.113771  ORF Transcript_63787/g.113771 Transcript_63787/m.113771 type:complete len:815 (-) Transcript_63787:93-2537(-)